LRVKNKLKIKDIGIIRDGEIERFRLILEFKIA